MEGSISSLNKKIEIDETIISKISAIIERAYLHGKTPHETQEEIKRILMEAK